LDGETAGWLEPVGRRGAATAAPLRRLAKILARKGLARPIGDPRRRGCRGRGGLTGSSAMSAISLAGAGKPQLDVRGLKSPALKKDMFSSLLDITRYLLARQISCHSYIK
jgi:hypothetical protein